MPELRPNRAKHKLEHGEVVSIIDCANSPDIAEFVGPFGFDAVWVETEHGPVDFKDIPDLTRACDLWGMTSVVRVNANQPGLIYRTLDVGAQAVVVPHINTADEARAVVDAAKFYPLGARGNFTSRQGIGVPDYQDRANDETMLIVLIEDIVAVNNLAEILEVDNIDVFFVATGDLSQSMGLLGQATHADVVAVANDAIGQIVGAGRVAGAVVDDTNLERYLSRGVRWLMAHWESWVTDGAKAYLRKVASASGA